MQLASGCCTRKVGTVDDLLGYFRNKALANSRQMSFLIHWSINGLRIWLWLYSKTCRSVGILWSFLIFFTVQIPQLTLTRRFLNGFHPNQVFFCIEEVPFSCSFFICSWLFFIFNHISDHFACLNYYRETYGNPKFFPQVRSLRPTVISFSSAASACELLGGFFFFMFGCFFWMVLLTKWF